LFGADEVRLGVSERKTLRRLLGPVKENEGQWRSRYSEELQDLLNETKLCVTKVGQAMSNRLTECECQGGYSGPG
jgi:hypothetical protein